MSLLDLLASALTNKNNKIKNKKDLNKLRREYKDARSILDSIIIRSEYYKQQRDELEKFISVRWGKNIPYETKIPQLPTKIKDSYFDMRNHFHPGDQNSVIRVRKCFEEHQLFAQKTKDVIDDFLDELDKYESKIERAEYMKKSNDKLNNNWYYDPTNFVEEELSKFVEKRVIESDIKTLPEYNYSEKISDSKDYMVIEKLVYFIAEELRKRHDKDYSFGFYTQLSDAYPEQSALICERLPLRCTRDELENKLDDDFGSHEDLPPLSHKHIEDYILPRVFDDVPPKTPEEIRKL